MSDSTALLSPKNRALLGWLVRRYSRAQLGRLLLAELPLKSAVRLAADITGRPKNSLYDAALALRKAGGDG